MADASAGLEVQGNTLLLRGDLGFATVGDLLAPGREAIAAAGVKDLVLDLGAVEKSDSAGLALLLDWLRAARSRGLSVELTGVPPQLADIARVSGLGGLMGLAETTDAT